MSKDPYSYFRVEAHELLDGLAKGVLSLERDGLDRETVSRLLRLAHTLKGAARVVRQAPIAESAHGVEDVLAVYRDRQGEMPRDDVGRMLELIDQCSEELKSLEAKPEEGSHKPSAQREADDPIDSVRVEIARIDATLYGIADAQTHLEALRQNVPRLDQLRMTTRWLAQRLSGRHESRRENGTSSRSAAAVGSTADELRALADDVYQSMRESIERLERDLADIRSQTGELRLLSANTIQASLERSARDVGDALHKPVALEMIGGEQRLDAHVLLGLRDALIHAVRNAVAHGIETESERLAAGKPLIGRICVRVQRTSSKVSFCVEDDGRGLDIAGIRRVAAVRGLLPSHAADVLDSAEAVRLLFQGGVSTSSAVSEFSGRGVGLDLVRATAAKLKGDVRLRSEPGRSTTLEISVPVSIESISVLGAVVGDQTVFLPFAKVRQALRTTEQDFVKSAAGLAILVGEEIIAYRCLGSLLDPTRQEQTIPKSSSAVVVQVGETCVAVGVDRLLGLRDVVVRPLPRLCGTVPLVAGTAINGLGDPELVIDPASLVAAVTSHSAPVTPAAPVPRPSVLVVDDSLTTRMLEQSVLEAAGFQVDLAISGEEALIRARERPHSLFVVDVEMPGMNGFELLQRFQGDPQLRETPAIMVTSLTSEEDRRRAREAGARDFMVKSEFDETRLLAVVRRLIQEGSR